MTIAYSNKYDAWATRYSFEPTCYAFSDNYFVSSKDDGGFWRHDVNPLRCSFYGDSYGASLEVSSSHDPSSVKIFNSVSLETNIDEWEASVHTNDEYGQKEKQQGNISSFENKEGFKYADMPRSEINSTSNVFSLVRSPNFLKPNTANTIYDADDLSISRSFYLDYFADPNISLPVSKQGGVVVYSVRNGALVQLIEGVDTFAESIEDNLVTFKFSLPSWEVGVGGFISLVNQMIAYPAISTNITPSIYAQTLVLVSSAVISGDQMRGPYVRINLTTPTTEPLELHAINVDYAFSKLDARLTQNT